MKRAIGQPGFAASGRPATSNNLLAPAPAYQPSGNTPRPQMICLLSANPHHNAFRGGAASPYSGGRALLGLPDIIRWFGMASGRCRSDLVHLSPTQNVPFVCPALAEVSYGTKSRPDRPTRQLHLAGANVHRPPLGNQETNVSKPDHPRRTEGCSGSSQQNARRARPWAKARLVEANAQSILGPLARTLREAAVTREEPQGLRRATRPLRAPWTRSEEHTSELQ